MRCIVPHSVVASFEFLLLCLAFLADICDGQWVVRSLSSYFLYPVHDAA